MDNACTDNLCMALVLADKFEGDSGTPANAVTAAVSGTPTAVTAAVSGTPTIVTAEDTQ